MATHLPGIPKDLTERIRQALKLPEATFAFRYQFDGLFDPSLGRGILLQVVTGAIVLILERDQDLNLHFVHSSPGTGTRIATVPLSQLKGSSAVTIIVAWSPKETRLVVADAENPKKSIKGTDRPSQRKYRVGANGDVYQIGDEGVEVMGVSIFSGSRPLLTPTAIESWTETTKAIEILLRGTSPDGFIFENVASNMAIVMLITGLETYCRRRFLELEDEGMKADYVPLAWSFLSKREREMGVAQAIEQEARDEGISSIRKLVEMRRIDFQCYADCKRAYKKAYGIRFGEDLGVSNAVLEELQRIIDYRHRIVHLSPLIGMLNQDRVPPEEPVVANQQYVGKALKTVDDFIKGLHQATLRLRPS